MKVPDSSEFVVIFDAFDMTRLETLLNWSVIPENDEFAEDYADYRDRFLESIAEWYGDLEEQETR